MVGEQLPRPMLVRTQAVKADAGKGVAVVIDRIEGNERQQQGAAAVAVCCQRLPVSRQGMAADGGIATCRFAARAADAVPCVAAFAGAVVARLVQLGKQLGTDGTHVGLHIGERCPACFGKAFAQRSRDYAKGKDGAFVGIDAAGCRTHRRFCRDADGADGGEECGAGRASGEGHAAGGTVAEEGRDGIGTCEKQGEVHVAVAAVVRGIDQPGFRRQRRFRYQRLAHCRRYRLRLLL